MTHASAGYELTSSVIPPGLLHRNDITLPNPSDLTLDAAPEREGDDRWIRTQIQEANA
jgi:hypothetical protein